MVRKTNDKKVVKAIALGLAAMITAGTMQPMMAYAADGDVDTTGEAIQDGTSKEDVDVADVEEAKDKVDEIEKFDPANDGLAKDTLEGLNAGFASLDDSVKEDGAVESGVESDVNAALGKLNGKLDKNEINVADLGEVSTEDTSVKKDIELVGANIDTSEVENAEKAIKAAQESVDGAEGVDGAIAAAENANTNAETNANFANTDAGIINDAADKANNLVKDGQDKVDEIAGIVSDANAAIQESQEKFDESTSAEDMQKYQEEMQKAYDEADEKYENSLSAYNNIKDELAKAEKAYEDAQKNYKEEYEKAVKACGDASEDFDAAEDAYNTASEDFDKAEKAYDEAVDGYNDQVGRYNTALSNANSKLAAAEDALGAAKDKLATLKDAAEKAESEIKDNADKVAELIEKQTAIANCKGENPDWNKADAFFESYLKNYYATVMGYGDVTVDMKSGRVEANSEYNYFVLTYKDTEGVEKSVYLNFKLGSDNKQFKDEKLNLIVFEKTKDEVLAAKAILASGATKGNAEGTYRYVDAEDNVHYLVKIKGSNELKDYKVDVDDVVLVEGTNIQLISGKVFVVADDDTVTEAIVTNTNEDETEKTVTTVDEDSKTEEYVYDKVNKVVVKQIKADVTTVTYTKNTLDSGEEKFESQEAAENALNTALGEAKIEEENVDSNSKTFTSETSYTSNVTATGTYVQSAFTSKIVLSTGDFKIIGEINDEKLKKELKNSKYKVNTVVKYENNDYYVVEAGDLENYSSKINTGKITGFFDTASATATQSVTLAKVEKETVKVDNSLKELLKDYGYKPSNNTNKNNERLKTAYIKYMGENCLYVDENSVTIDNNGKISVKCVKKEEISASGNYTSTDNMDEAEKAAKTNALDGIKRDKGVVINTSTSVASSSTNTLYSYSVNYWDVESKTENLVVATQSTTSENLNLTKYKTNSNWDKENEVGTLYDDAYKAFLKNDYAGLKEKYQKLVDQVNDADEAVKTAQDSVDEIKAKISDYEEKSTMNKTEYSLTGWDVTKYEATIAELKELLAIEEAKLDEAKKIKSNLEQQLADNVKKIEQKIAEEEAARQAAVDANGTTAANAGDDATNDVVVIANANVPMAAAPAAIAVNAVSVNANATVNANADANVEGVAGDAVANEGAVEIADNNTPKAAEATKADDDKKVAIGDNDVALAAAPVEAEDAMNWWWLLVVAVLGATGYELYKKNQKKKALKEGADSLDK